MLEKEKKYFKRKLLIIELMEECDRRVKIEVSNMDKFRHLPNAHANSKANFRRYQDIKAYLVTRY